MDCLCPLLSHLPYKHFADQPDAAKSGKESAALRIWLDTNSADAEKEARGEFSWKPPSTGVGVHMDVCMVSTRLERCVHQLMGMALVVIQTISQFLGE